MAFADLFQPSARELAREEHSLLVPTGPEAPERCRPGLWLLLSTLCIAAWHWPQWQPSQFQEFTLQRWEDKIPSCKEFPKLDILWVEHSNLDYQGPDTGEEGLVYRVRNYKGEHMEMVFNALRPFHSFDPSMFGLHGFYGSLNVAELSEAHLMVTFRDHETKQPVVMEEFAMTFYDIDQGFARSGIEQVTIQGDWTVAIVSQNTGIHVEHSPHFRRIQFGSTLVGMAMDSPVHPLTMTYEQFHKAVTIRFNDVDSFQVSLAVTSAGAHHRFFEFAGEASVLCAHLPEGSPPPIGRAYWNPKKHAPPGLIPKRPFETVAKTRVKWVFEGWKVEAGQKVAEDEGILWGKLVFGEDQLKHNMSLPSPAQGTIEKRLPELQPGNTVLPDVGVAIIAYPVLRPPGLHTQQGYDHLVVTRSAYRFVQFKVKLGSYLQAGTVIFTGQPVIGDSLGKLVSFSSSEAGVLEELVSVQNGDFILADVAVARLRPRVISPPGLRAQEDVDHVVETHETLKFVSWKVGEGDDVAEGQAVLLAEVVGTKQRRTLSAPEGFVAERLTLEAGEILEAGVGVLRVRVSRRDTSKDVEAHQPLPRKASKASKVPIFLGFASVGLAGLAGLAFFWLVPRGPPPPRPPPEIISVTTNETVTVMNGGFQHRPTGQHYSHHIQIHTHHHGSHHAS